MHLFDPLATFSTQALTELAWLDSVMEEQSFLVEGKVAVLPVYCRVGSSMAIIC